MSKFRVRCRMVTYGWFYVDADSPVKARDAAIDSANEDTIEWNVPEVEVLTDQVDDGRPPSLFEFSPYR
jgi:hypothetical protein